MSLPSEYQEVEWIASSGTQCINTDYILKANDIVKVDCIIISNSDRSYEALFGARNSNYQSSAFVFFTRFNGSNVPTYSRTGAETGGSNLIYNERIELTCNGKVATWTNGTNTYSLTTSGTPSDCVNNCFIFELNTASSGQIRQDGSKSTIKLYSFKVYDSDGTTLKKSYIPCYNKNTLTVGLYETVESVFCTDMNGGTFTKGPDIIQASRIKKLKFNGEVFDLGSTDVGLYNATITTSWTGSSAPYSQTLTIDGILATDVPIVDLIPSSTFATAQAEIKDYANIYKMTVTAANTIVVYATKITTTPLNITLRCIR